MENRNTKKALEKDIDFLDEMNETLDKIDNRMNDSASIQHLRTLITEWRGELASSVPQANELLPHVSGSAWIIIAKTQPITTDYKLPIYWRKNIAERDAKKFGGTVKKVKMSW
jgi:hypothetical protein